MVIAVLDLEAATCGRCGTRRDEWGTYGNDGRLQPFDPPPYRVKDTYCPGCAPLDLAARDRKDKQPAGVSTVLARNSDGR